MERAIAIESDRYAGGNRELLRLAWPFILTNSFWMLQITLDRILLSRTGSEVVGAAMAAALVFWTPICLLQNTVGYATTFVAQYTGAGQHHRVGPAVWQALFFAVVAGLAFMCLAPFSAAIVALGGHSDHLQELEATYFFCLCFSGLPTLVTAAASSFFAGRGESRVVLLISGTGLFVNIFFAYSWIFGEWGFAELGIAGAGWATVVGTSTSAVLGVSLILLPTFRRTYNLGLGWRFEPELARRMLYHGVPNGILSAVDCLVFTVFVFLTGRIGEDAMAASSMAFTLNLIAFFPSMGIAQAVGVLVGQRLGENRPDLAERTTWNGFRLILCFMCLIGLVYLFLGEPLAMLFRSDQDQARWSVVKPLVTELLRFVALYSLFDGMNLVFSFALRGAGDTRYVTLRALLISWLVMVIPTWIGSELGWGIYWAWTFASSFVVLLGLMFLARFRQGKWRTMRVIEKVVSG